jgi:hypothetical protein
MAWFCLRFVMIPLVIWVRAPDLEGSCHGMSRVLGTARRMAGRRAAAKARRADMQSGAFLSLCTMVYSYMYGTPSLFCLAFTCLPFLWDYYRMARQFSGREAPHCGTIHQLHPVWLGFQPGCMLARCCTMEFSLIGFQKWPESNRKIIFQSVPFSFGFPSPFSVRTKWSALDEPISPCEKNISMDIQSSSNQPFTNFRWRDIHTYIYIYIHIYIYFLNIDRY